MSKNCAKIYQIENDIVNDGFSCCRIRNWKDKKLKRKIDSVNSNSFLFAVFGSLWTWKKYLFSTHNKDVRLRRFVSSSMSTSCTAFAIAWTFRLCLSLTLFAGVAEKNDNVSHSGNVCTTQFRFTFLVFLRFFFAHAINGKHIGATRKFSIHRINSILSIAAAKK